MKDTLLPRFLYIFIYFRACAFYVFLYAPIFHKTGQVGVSFCSFRLYFFDDHENNEPVANQLQKILFRYFVHKCAFYVFFFFSFFTFKRIKIHGPITKHGRHDCIGSRLETNFKVYLQLEVTSNLFQTRNCFQRVLEFHACKSFVCPE